jgi:hypothetical protein
MDTPGPVLDEDVPMADPDADPFVPDADPLFVSEPNASCPPVPPRNLQSPEQAAPNSSAARDTYGGRATGEARYVHIEEVEDEDAPSAGAKLSATTTMFEDIREAQEGRNKTQYGPFGDKEMWEVAKFMVDCLGQGEADRFLKLPRVRLVLPSCCFSSY